MVQENLRRISEERENQPTFFFYSCPTPPSNTVLSLEKLIE
jgi:hypothetical protein